jgi:hypothetical protein
MLDHIKATHPSIDAVFWTGDNSPHNTWNNKQDEVTNYTRLVSQELYKYFANDAAMFPAIGNHDTWPVNVQDFSLPRNNVNINGFAQDWVEWIGEDAALEFYDYGYCSIPFKLANGKEVKGSRVLSINTNVSNSENWYLPGFKNDPGQHIEWLEAQLK